MRQTDIPLILSFRYSRIQEFVMYAGSQRGTVVCDTAGVNPTDIWADEINKKENMYKEMELVFIDDTRLKIIPYGYFYRYRMKGGMIEVLISENNKWVPFAYGNRDKLAIRLGLTDIVDATGMEQKCILNHYETCWSAFNYAELSALFPLKDKKTKIAWCNIHYIFQ